MWQVTRHAKRRMRQRSVGSSRLRRSLHGKKRYLGNGVTRTEYEDRGVTTTVVYKQRGRKRVVLSTWKKRSRLPRTT